MNQQTPDKRVKKAFKKLAKGYRLMCEAFNEELLEEPIEMHEGAWSYDGHTLSWWNTLSEEFDICSDCNTEYSETVLEVFEAIGYRAFSLLYSTGDKGTLIVKVSQRLTMELFE